MSAWQITAKRFFSRKRIGRAGDAGHLRRSPGIEPLEARLCLSSAGYTWQNVNVSGGGFVDGIFYDSHNQNVIYARTDVGGLFKSVNDGGNWTQLLDWVGGNTSGSGNGTQFQEFGVLSFAIDPENSNNLYAMVGEYSGTNGDVLYSTDAGATWSMTPLSFWVGGNSMAAVPVSASLLILSTATSFSWAAMPTACGKAPMPAIPSRK